MSKIPIKTTSRKESNRFLRAVWAQVRSEFGKCAWQYLPDKNGASQFIRFGFADLGEATLEVGVTYAQRDCITELHFEEAGNPFDDRLRACIARAIESAPSPKRSWLSLEGILFPILLPFAPRVRSTYALEPGNGNRSRVLIRVESYDSVDERSQAIQRLSKLLDLLAVASNCVLATPGDSAFNFPAQVAVELYDNEGNALTSTTDQVHENPPRQSVDPDWYDGYPIIEGRVAPCDADLDAIEKLLSGDEEAERDLFSAAAHFRTGLEMEHKSGSAMQGFGGVHELSMTLYVSALEVISANASEPAASCKSCGQPVYAISRRVTDYVLSREGEAVGAVIKRMYARRSKYLHGGILFSTRSYGGTTLPQLDSSDETGCMHPIPLVPLLNVREWTSHMLRCELRARAAAHARLDEIASG
jgi:hypothetical protein